MSCFLRSVLFIALCVHIVFSVGCSPQAGRPFGVVRVGKLNDLVQGAARYYDEYALLVQRDSLGIRAMSTLDPVTLIPLKKAVIDDHVVLRDPRTGAIFNELGTIQSSKEGKDNRNYSTANRNLLSHYRVMLDRVNGEFEVLVVVGELRSPDWRLTVRP